MIRKHPAFFWGISITGFFLILWMIGFEFFDVLELKYYDARMKLRTDAHSVSDIVIVDIDDDSIEKLGRWPWPRSVIADGIKKISVGHPRLIGLNLILSEPEKNSGLVELDRLSVQFSEFSDSMNVDGSVFLKNIDEMRNRLDNDKKLEAAIREAGNVILPVFVKGSDYGVRGVSEEHPELTAQTLSHVSIPAGTFYPRASELNPPIPEFMAAAKGIGHINFVTDIDGTARKERLIYEYKGLYIPSYPLRLAAASMNIPVSDLKVTMGASIMLGDLNIPLTRYSECLINFKGKRGAFRKYGFFDVLTNKISLERFKNKIVLISPSAAGIINPLNTPVDIAMPMGEFSANTVWSVLNRSFIRQPYWDWLFELSLMFFLGILITFVFPRMRAKIAAMSFVVVVMLIVFAGTYLFVADGIWLSTSYPLMLLLAGYLGITSIRFFLVETDKEKVEGESAETHRMLGISFQEQGMLDMAFDKFRRVPMDLQMMDIFYTLAQDYERKRQWNKAAFVYDYMADYDKSYKDIVVRRDKLIQASDTLVFGEGLPKEGTIGADISVTSTGVAPTLGRYEIVRRLGKGAMGIVYLGKDPRINRTTAIKTMSFSDEFEPSELEQIKETFFREAESAGTLSHPNIVTIYDAGTEQDMAYIAMEYLEGTDFNQFTDINHLLPIRKVIEYVADIACGLSYAHSKGIVHRDIKPANIMLLNSGVVKITDFGIARITATSQTLTGVIKGTPHYMSPEQFSGERVDGRSDLFSLGTMMFRLLTGELPFHADTPAVLMHKILNEKHPDPRQINPKIIKPLSAILDKALEKDKENRYQTGADMADHLRALSKKIDAAVERKKKDVQ